MKRKDIEDEIINVFGEIWEIEFDDNLLEDEEAKGQLLERSHTIKLAPEDDPNELIHTLLHECFHAYTRRTGVIQGISHETDETIAEGFPRFLVENFDIKLKT
jgi:hypothetical protein